MGNFRFRFLGKSKFRLTDDLKSGSVYLYYWSTALGYLTWPCSQQFYPLSITAVPAGSRFSMQRPPQLYRKGKFVPLMRDYVTAPPLMAFNERADYITQHYVILASIRVGHPLSGCQLPKKDYISG